MKKAIHSIGNKKDYKEVRNKKEESLREINKIKENQSNNIQFKNLRFGKKIFLIILIIFSVIIGFFGDLPSVLAILGFIITLII